MPALTLLSLPPEEGTCHLWLTMGEALRPFASIPVHSRLKLRAALVAAVMLQAKLRFAIPPWRHCALCNRRGDGASQTPLQRAPSLVFASGT